MLAVILLLVLTAVSYTGLAGAANLYVASQNIITSLSLSNATLAQTGTHTGCTAAPSWLTFDAPNRMLYCFDDDTTNNGSVSSYRAATSGVLTLVARIDTPPGPVSGVLYGRQSTSADAGLLVANYHSQSAVTFTATAAGALTRAQTFTFTAPAGPSPRQEKPHPHQALVDPSGGYLIVPDLGADVVRWFSRSGLSLTEQPAVAMAAGSGPRHAAFWVNAGGVTYMYVLAELANRITTYRVDLGEGVFTAVFNTTSLGRGITPRSGTMAAEILVSPDGKFVTVSNRNDASSTLPSGATSDTLVTFTPQEDGSLEFVQAAAAGGSGPRHFSFNKAGDRVAVGLQTNGVVAVLERSVETGEIGGVVAQIAAGTAPACVVWDE